jgi:DNA-binding Lrp family transcriptional regulator
MWSHRYFASDTIKYVLCSAYVMRKPNTVPLSTFNSRLNTGYNQEGRWKNDDDGLSTKLDKISMNIIKILLDDPNAKSGDIAANLKTPLSTIQRKRAKLEISSILRKSYQLDLTKLGLREAELLVTVKRGKCRYIAQQLLTRFKNNVRSCTLRIGDPEINVAADIVYKNSPELLEIVEMVKNMSYVSYVEWSEITEVVGENKIDLQFILRSFRL